MMKSYAVLVSILALLISAPASQAQPLPSNIRMVVPFAAGASTDVAARAIAQQLTRRLGVSVIVENRVGASGMIGSQSVVRGPKDGSQLLFTSLSTISAAATTRNAPFSVTADLVPVSIVYEAPLLFAVPIGSAIKTPQDLVAAARVKPDQLSHGTAGVGTMAHLAAELFNDRAKAQLLHIPYKGAAAAIPDLIAGRLDLMIGVNSTFGGHFKGGLLRQIGIATDKPHPSFPGLPTMNVVAPGYAVSLWTGVFVPTGTPAAIVQRLNKEINEIARSKELAELLHSDGATLVDFSPEQAARLVSDSYATWKAISTSRNIVLD